MAIVNEDPEMVKYLIEKGADIHQRACGNFFLPEDQGERKKSKYNQEQFELPLETNYAS